MGTGNHWLSFTPFKQTLNLACSAGVFWVGETIVVAAIFDFTTVEDWGEKKAPFPPLFGKFQLRAFESKNIWAPEENACTAG